MLYIDNRVGSKELAPSFSLPCELHRLEFGDFAFIASNHELIGIERKSVSDFINSMVTGRLTGHQLPGLVSMYYRTYLIMEGIWRACPKDGILELLVRGKWKELSFGTRRYTGKEIMKFIFSQMEAYGVHFLRTSGPSETVSVVTWLYSWWKDKLCKHKSFYQKHTPAVSLYRPNLTCRVLLELDGVGLVKARAVSKKYRTIPDILATSTDELAKIDGIGYKLSESILKQLKGVVE